MLHFTSTDRSEKMLNYNGFQYTLKRERQTVVEWRCRSRNCSSTLSLSRDNTIVVHEPNEHGSSCFFVLPYACKRKNVDIYFLMYDKKCLSYSIKLH